MFNTNYFAPRYFAPRYFTKLGGEVLPLSTGRQNYALFPFRLNAPEIEYRDKRVATTFRDKRKDYA